MAGFLAFILVLILLVPGCSHGTDIRYLKWSNEQGWSSETGAANATLHFTFEYPDSLYVLTSQDIEKRNELFHLDTVTQPVTSEIPMVYRSVEFMGHREGRDALVKSDYRGFTTDLLVTYSLSGGINQIITEPPAELLDYWVGANVTGSELYLTMLVKILDDSNAKPVIVPVTIDGYPGYSVKFNYSDNYQETAYQSREAIWAVLQIGEQVVEIKMDAWEEEVAEAEEYYNHLLETFAISQ